MMMIFLTDCTYGDKATGCSKIYCSTADTDYLSSCCGTCKYGTPITTSSTTSREYAMSFSAVTTSQQFIFWKVITRVMNLEPVRQYSSHFSLLQSKLRECVRGDCPSLQSFIKVVIISHKLSHLVQLFVLLANLFVPLFRPW